MATSSTNINPTPTSRPIAHEASAGSVVPLVVIVVLLLLALGLKLLRDRRSVRSANNTAISAEPSNDYQEPDQEYLGDEAADDPALVVDGSIAADDQTSSPAPLSQQQTADQTLIQLVPATAETGTFEKLEDQSPSPTGVSYVYNKDSGVNWVFTPPSDSPDPVPPDTTSSVPESLDSTDLSGAPSADLSEARSEALPVAPSGDLPETRLLETGYPEQPGQSLEQQDTAVE